MEKKMFYLEIYKTILLTLIFVLLIIFYQKLSSPIHTISSLTENLGNEIERNIYEASTSQANRDAVIADLTNLASLAQQYFRKPTALGGGGDSFDGWSIPNMLKSTGNGEYKADISSGSITLIGTGVEIGNDGSSRVGITMIIGNDRIINTTINN